MQNVIFSQIPIEELTNLISNTIRQELKLIIPESKTTEPEPDFITRQETAKILGISLPTLNNWSKRSIILSYRIGTRIRYKKSEVLNSVKNVNYSIVE